jgi:hypothetical protein
VLIPETGLLFIRRHCQTRKSLVQSGSSGLASVPPPRGDRAKALLFALSPLGLGGVTSAEVSRNARTTTLTPRVARGGSRGRNRSRFAKRNRPVPLRKARPVNPAFSPTRGARVKVVDLASRETSAEVTPLGGLPSSLRARGQSKGFALCAIPSAQELGVKEVVA